MSGFLGIAAFHRDAAAALVVDGSVVAAVQEERFTGKPGDSAFPRRSVRWCLDQGGVRAQDLDGIVVSQKPLQTFERVLASQLVEFPRSARGFSRAMFLWLGDRLWMKGRAAQELEVPADKILFCEHLVAHAASAVHSAGLETAAVLVLDDVGEWATTGLFSVRGGELAALSELRFPDSLGLVASAMTQFLGFVPGQDEEVLGALGAYGEATHLDALRELVTAEDGGAFHVDREAFPFRRGMGRMFGPRLEEALGAARESGQPLLYGAGDAHHADVAASALALLTDRAVAAASELRRLQPDVPDLVLTGFLAMDPRIVEAIAASSGFDRVFVAPYADDAGAALGAAIVAAGGAQPGSPFLGPLADDVLGEHEGASVLGDDRAVVDELTRRLAAGQLVGWARGRLALGRGGLGRRAALTSASTPDGRARLLAALQLSEPWRECTLVTALDRAEEWFESPPAAAMATRFGGSTVRLRDRARDLLGASVAPDGRARVLLVDHETDPLGARLLEALHAAGHPVLLHTDLRRRGETIARQEADVLELLGRSGLDAAVIGRRLYERSAAAAP